MNSFRFQRGSAVLRDKKSFWKPVRHTAEILQIYSHTCPIGQPIIEVTDPCFVTVDLWTKRLGSN